MKITVLMGGASSEREVSLASGREVARALRGEGHEVVEIDVKDEFEPSYPSHTSNNNEALIRFVSNPDMASSDVVFIVLHGGAGENGTLQAILDVMGAPYTGSGMLASALAMDKVLSKRIFDVVGIPTPDWRNVQNADARRVEAAISELGGLPIVTKPRNQGSTIGISIVQKEDQIAAAVDCVKKYSRDVLVEKYIVGREITVGVLGERALPVIEVAPEKGFYNYECKYTRGRSKYIVPAKIQQKKQLEAQELALKAYKVLGCQDFARVDFRLSHDGEFHCLEVNTIPGMTGTSLVPMAARATGISFPQLLEEICKLALSHRSSAGILEKSSPSA